MTGRPFEHDGRVCALLSMMAAREIAKDCCAASARELLPLFHVPGFSGRGTQQPPGFICPFGIYLAVGAPHRDGGLGRRGSRSEVRGIKLS